ncbi:MAG: flagellar basal-body rod protein FlgF [Rhodospirillaceae bacterium]|nr:MAG: flagellar basal-body rod protein FlgF [Rhodospirillaceae bacterium]
MYSRGGHFRLNEAGQIVTAEGLAVLDTNDRPLFVAPNESRIKIARDGTVSTENGAISQLRVVKFADPQDVQPVVAGLYDTTQQPEDITRPDILQGALEESNVKPIVEITHMIQLHRMYEGVNKMLEIEHDRRRKMVDTVLRVA